MVVVNQEKITLSNVKKSNYWDLLALIVWNHYSEERFQDESMVDISEQWHGLADDGNGSYSSSHWQNKNHTQEGYTRTLESIQIKLTRSDYIARINLTIGSGAVHFYAHSVLEEENFKHRRLNVYNSLAITNWMLTNEFFKIEI
jgi:hypothetical protein